MLRIEKLSRKNSADVSSLIFQFQKDHFEKYGNYYKLSENAEDKISSIIADLIKKINTRVFIAYLDSDPAGYIFLRIDKNVPIYKVVKYGYISGLFVAPRFRKSGVAKKLLEQAEKWFADKDVGRIELKVNFANGPGISFWKKNGFSDQQILMVKE